MSERNPLLVPRFSPVQFVGSRPAGAADGEEAIQAALVGAPLDHTTSFWPGTRFAPGRVREASEGIETYSPDLDRDLVNLAFADLGDVPTPFGDVTTSLGHIEDAVESVLDRGALPFLVGGEHLITLSAIRAVRRHHAGVALVQLDAHTDLRDTYMGVALSHATVMLRAAELLGPSSIYQFGIRSGAREEFQFARENTHLFRREVIAPLERVLAELADRPIYVTIDIDVVDPGAAPGVGTPEPGGITPQELFDAIHLLGRCRVVGCDIVELCPPADSGAVTATLVAKAVREALLSFASDRDASRK